MERFVAKLLFFCLLAGCAGESPLAYKLYPGPQRTPRDIAIVRLGSVEGARFNGLVARRSDWGEVQLLPGDYSIEWGQEFGVSVMVEPSGFALGMSSAEVRLQAGHVYTLKADRTTGHGYRMYFWITDDTEGRIVAGTRKP